MSSQTSGRTAAHSSPGHYVTSVGTSDRTSITVHGLDLCQDLIGHASLTDLIFLGAQNRRPEPNESALLNALMIGVAEHGFTPSSLAARLTWLGAPEATQAAVAAGLLGAGSVYLGVMELTAKLLQERVAAAAPDPDLAAIAREVVADHAASGEQLPGFGHPIHRPVDPRTVRYLEVSDGYGLTGVHTRLLLEIHAALEAQRGKPITLNAAGTFGSLLADLGFGWQAVRTVVTAARAVGLVGHIAEEARAGFADSSAQALFLHVQQNTEYLGADS